MEKTKVKKQKDQSESRLDILWNIFVNPDEEDAEIENHFIEKGEEASEIVKRASEFICQKEDEMRKKNRVKG